MGRCTVPISPDWVLKGYEMRTIFFALLALGSCGLPGKIHRPDCRPCLGQVIVFIALDCPVSQKYIARLNEVFLSSHDSVAWTGYVPEKKTKADIDQFARDYQVAFPLVSDKGLRQARARKATITPEVFVLDNNGNTVYSGAIDNWFFELGKYRAHTTSFFLKDGIKALLTDTPPPVSKTQAVGCFIQQH